MFTKNGSHPQRKGSNVRPGVREVIVADPNQSTPICSDENTLRPADNLWSQEERDKKAFKVFLKKNLAFEKPAPDLLVKIHQRIDALK